MKWDVKIKEDTGEGYILESDDGKTIEVTYEVYQKVYNFHQRNYQE